jgi:hypothetical protein
MPDLRLLCHSLWIAAALVVVTPLLPELQQGFAAHADDDDDDDDGDDGDDDGGGGGGGGGGAPSSDDDDDDDNRPTVRPSVNDDDSRPVRQPAARRPAPPPPPVELPRRAPRELVVTGLSPEDLSALVDEGFTVLEELAIVRNGPVLHRLRAPRGVPIVEARARVRAAPSADSADFNHFYRTNEDVVTVAGIEIPPVPGAVVPCTHLNCTALELVGWPAERSATCMAPIAIGVIDTGVNIDHAGLPQDRIDLTRLVDPDLPASSETHGTSVLSMLIGTEARAPGLVPEARVIAVDVFSRQNGDERTDAATLIRAIDLLAQRGVRVANLSLAGPRNTVLAAMLEQVAQDGMLVVAAAGNGGPTADPAWPAASRHVLAVTAVDAFGRIYRRAQRGPHIDVAAPGVEVWAAASIRGVRARTGTSYATPWATAAAAIIMAQDAELTPAEAIQRLGALTVDTGEDGADPVFGQGILSLQGLCGPS